jgi:hypothetical protein
MFNARPIRSIVLCCIFLIVSLAQVRADETSDLKASVNKATQWMKDNKVEESLQVAEQVSSKIQQLVAAAPPKELGELKKLHAQIVRLRESLEIQGAELKDLPEWEELLKAKKMSTPVPTPAATPSPTEKPAPESKANAAFVKDIAPWLVDQCGRCHIAAERGGFSMATFNTLMKGPKAGVVIFPGDPTGSRIVEVIESGDMPRGGGKVSPEHLGKLKQWIKDGAKLDGSPDAATIPLPQLARTSTMNSAAKAAVKAETTLGSAPTGKETVSFATDIAPILVSHCDGCHYNGTRSFGDLRFNSFADLSKGGTSGNVIEPYKPEESLLVRKLMGTSGARMPMGRPALSEEKIQLVSTWIKEGAAFDGKAKDTALDQVIGQAWAATATHQELLKRRMKNARDKWKIVAPNRQPNEAFDDEILVLGDIGEENAKALLAQAKNSLNSLRKMFKLNNKEPVVKGGFVIFALKQRYDYSEFGTMLERRAIPADWSSHWREGAIDSYIALVFDKTESKINESSLLQQMVSLWIGSFDGAPKWFADGAGRQALAISVGPNDARVQPWIKRLPETMAQLKSLKPFLDGSMNDEDAAIIGFGIVRFLHETKMKNQYDSLVRGLVQGKNFEQAAAASIGKPELFLQRVLGKK